MDFRHLKKKLAHLPTRLITEQQVSGRRFSETAAAIEASDQSFCMAAHADMVSIVQNISDAGDFFSPYTPARQTNRYRHVPGIMKHLVLASRSF